MYRFLSIVEHSDNLNANTSRYSQIELRKTLKFLQETNFHRSMRDCRQILPKPPFPHNRQACLASVFEEFGRTPFRSQLQP
jgi:hypothetical protein